MDEDTFDHNGIREDISALGSSKKRILILLKKNGTTSLVYLAKQLGISKMGTLKHVKDLEERGYLERELVPHGVGRPKLHLKIRDTAIGLFPKSYGDLALSMLNFIEENLGRPGIIKALEKRQKAVYDEYKERMKGDLLNRVKILTESRDKDGYMAEFSVVDSQITISEYNCPVLEIADNYWEACVVERRMFEDLLGCRVETTHQIVNGSNVCKFVITDLQ